MPRFVVTTREVHYCSYGIDATTKEEAIAKIKDGDGELVDDSLEYSETLAPGESYECDAWDVQESEEPKSGTPKGD